MNAALFDWIETAAGLVGWASASAAVLIMGAWVMRKVMGRRLGLRWRSALGWLVVVRLACLVAPPESRWSWRNSVVTAQRSLIGDAAMRVEGSVDTRGQAREDSASGLSSLSLHRQPAHEHVEDRLEALSARRETPRKDSASGLSSSHPPPTHEDVEHVEDRPEPEQSGDGRRQPLSSLRDIGAPVVSRLAVVWFVGAVGSFGMAVAKHLVFWRRVRVFSRPLPAGSGAEQWLDESHQLLRVRRRVRLRTIEGLGSPVVFGFFRPFILLPVEVAGGLTAVEARHIFLHELAHIRCGDVLANWLLIAVRALHWFNPLVWIALRRFVADRELLRDAMALRALPGGEAARSAYGHTLLRLATTLSRPGLSPGLASLIHTEKEIQRRIAMIKTPPDSNRRLWPQALAGGLALALVAVTFTAAASGQAPAAGPATELRKPDPSPAGLAASAVDPAAPPADPKAAPLVGLPAPVPAAGTDRDTNAGPPSGAPDIRTHLDEELVAVERSGADRWHINERRLAQLDSEIAKMAAEGKKQELDILTSLRGELLKEIYRAKYLPSVESPASGNGRYEGDATASPRPEKQKTARAGVEADPSAGAGAAMKPYLARLANGHEDEVNALRQQIAAMARQVEELQRQLTKSATAEAQRDLDRLIRDYQAQADEQAQLGAGPNHPDVVALKARLESAKRRMDESSKKSRGATEKRSKPSAGFRNDDPSLKPAEEVPPTASPASPEAEPKPGPKRPEN